MDGAMLSTVLMAVSWMRQQVGGMQGVLRHCRAGRRTAPTPTPAADWT